MNNKTEIKIYIVGGKYYQHYTSWIENPVVYVSNVEDADLVMFCGGEDINPSLYGEEPHYSTSWNDERDQEEIKIWNEAQKLQKKCMGICRGSQFVCALSGAKLIQHLQHPSWHTIETIEGKKFSVISTHHQLQYPSVLPDEDYRLIAWANHLSPFYYFNKYQKQRVLASKEAEIVEYYKTNALACQTHPEMMLENTLFLKYLNNLLITFLNQSKQLSC